MIRKVPSIRRLEGYIKMVIFLDTPLFSSALHLTTNFGLLLRQYKYYIGEAPLKPFRGIPSRSFPVVTCKSNPQSEITY